MPAKKPIARKMPSNSRLGAMKVVYDEPVFSRRRLLKGAGIAAGLGAAFGAYKFFRGKTLAARREILIKKTRHPELWVKLPFDKIERVVLAEIHPGTFSLVEKKASELGLGNDGVQRVLGALSRNPEGLKSRLKNSRESRNAGIALNATRRKLDNAIHYGDQPQKWQNQLDILDWSAKLPEETARELLLLSGFAKK